MPPHHCDRLPRPIWLLLVWPLLAGWAWAQDMAPMPATGQQIVTLDEVRALRPEAASPLDLYRFRNPVQVRGNAFNQRWQEPPTVEQISLSGGYVLYGLNRGLAAAGRALNKAAGGPEPVRPALARPPPLSAEQLQRAATLCANCIQPFAEPER